jgi:hypothetical protein
MKTKSVCSFERAVFRGWEAVYLRNGFVTLVAVPDIGGRVMAYNLEDYPYLFVDPDLAGKLFTAEENQGDGSLAAWKNYGGDKTWPSPQGWDNDQEWHGPPDPLLDTGHYQLQKLEGDDRVASLQMVSPPDPRTGVQITRQVTLRSGSSRVTLALSFRNISDRQIRWSIWDVVQLHAGRALPGGGLALETGYSVTVPLNPRSRFQRGFNVMFGDENNPQWKVDAEKHLFVGQYQWEIGKVGLDSPAGWIAFSNSAQRYAFAERFTYFPGAEYPDQGATVECWTVGRGKVANLNYANSQIYLMEAEVLSPFYTFQPGETHSFQIEWSACRCAGQIVDVIGAGCVHQPLAVEAVRDGLKLTGSFGVFDAGRLQLAWKDRSGKLMDPISIGEVSPLEMVELAHVFHPPFQAASLELQVLVDADGSLHTLTSCQL